MSARYVCKSCGGESPAGIGYACTIAGPLPAPVVGCRHPHADTCAVCSEPVRRSSPRARDWTHAHGSQGCGTGDGSVAYPLALYLADGLAD